MNKGKAKITSASGKGDAAMQHAGIHSSMVLENWVGLSQLQVSSMRVICSQLVDTINLVDTGMLELNQKFRSLAEGAKQQGKRVYDISHKAGQPPFLSPVLS